jgi:hypothetical protein
MDSSLLSGEKKVAWADLAIDTHVGKKGSSKKLLQRVRNAF